MAGPSGWKDPKTLKNARKRKRAAEKRRAQKIEESRTQVDSQEERSQQGSSSCLLRKRQSSSPDNNRSLPAKCIEPDVFWALPRKDRLSYRKQVHTLLGRIPAEYICPSEDDCLVMNAARGLREQGRAPNLVVTYPDALPGSLYRKNSNSA